MIMGLEDHTVARIGTIVWGVHDVPYDRILGRGVAVPTLRDPSDGWAIPVPHHRAVWDCGTTFEV
jgi:hypothetical protein